MQNLTHYFSVMIDDRKIKVSFKPFITGCERYNMLFAVGGIARRLRWDHYIYLGGLDNDLDGLDNDLACQK